MSILSADDAFAIPSMAEAIRRKVIRVSNDRVTYALKQERDYDWTDPEEWVRAACVAWLVVEKDYPPNRMRTEVTVPRRTPSDLADIVVFSDDACTTPYLVIENKGSGQTSGRRRQWIEQLFGNANSLRSPYALYDEGGVSFFYNVTDFPATEREANRMGDRTVVPVAYGLPPAFALVAGGSQDIMPAAPGVLGTRIRRAHGILWAGGRRDPLLAFDEWSKLLFAKVIDERRTPTGEPRRFQVGAGENAVAVANRVHRLFEEAVRDDSTIFPADKRIDLPDAKIADVVRVLQDISFTATEVDSIGRTFEEFFASVFRGGLGQYFTMRQIARFTVAVLDVAPSDYVLDPTAGSGGFLLEVLLQTWHRIDREFAGQSVDHVARLKSDFAMGHVYGIEIHDILSRICKINLLLHHDGHTNIEASRSCLDRTFANPRLNPPSERFSCIVGNPPFGDAVEAGDSDKLGDGALDDFVVARGRGKVDSEHLILERSVALLEPGGRLGLVVPDGVLNNQGENSNCPTVRRFLARSGRIQAIVSLPDYAFRRSGAQNKTSLLFFRKFTRQEARSLEQALARIPADESGEGGSLSVALEQSGLDYMVFLAEANNVGYTPSGAQSERNDLFSPAESGTLGEDQGGTILGEWRRFISDPAAYEGRAMPDCATAMFSELWSSHPSHRLDPKYHLFKNEPLATPPAGWVRSRLSDVMSQRVEMAPVTEEPDRRFQVMTLSQTGDIRPREAGKGRNPPEWSGVYLSNGPSSWFVGRSGDVVYSSIDLWKGCIAVIPPAFDGALVTKEFPVYRVTDARLLAAFLQCLLRSRYYQRAFRAITTGHSNRRRTQREDFEALEIAFPSDVRIQAELIRDIVGAKAAQGNAAQTAADAALAFSNLIDGRGAEELPEIAADLDDATEDAS